MNFALLVSKGDGDGSDLVEMKGWVVLVKVRGHPAYPHAGRLLAWKDPHRVVVLNHGGRKKTQGSSQYLHKLYNLSIEFGLGLKLNSGEENIFNFNTGNLWESVEKDLIPVMNQNMQNVF